MPTRASARAQAAEERLLGNRFAALGLAEDEEEGPGVASPPAAARAAAASGGPSPGERRAARGPQAEEAQRTEDASRQTQVAEPGDPGDDGPPADARQVPFDYYVVLDFECTCDAVNVHSHEIIEFPATFLNARTLEFDMEFHRYVRPSERPTLTEFCTRLTGIEQRQVDDARPLEAVLGDFHEFLDAHSFVCNRGDRTVQQRLFVICTDGPWDVRKFLRPESHRKRIRLQPYWGRYVDVRQAFSDFMGCGRCGVAKMLERLDMAFEGREHSGADDARNIARILAELLARGCKVSPQR